MNQLLTLATEYCQGEHCGTIDVSDGAIAGIFAATGVFILVAVIIGLIVFAFWLWMLIDAATRTEESYKKVGTGEKILWVLALIFSMFFGLGWLAAILYYFIVRKKAIALEAPKTKKK